MSSAIKQSTDRTDGNANYYGQTPPSEDKSKDVTFDQYLKQEGQIAPAEGISWDEYVDINNANVYAEGDQCFMSIDASNGENYTIALGREEYPECLFASDAVLKDYAANKLAERKPELNVRVGQSAVNGLDGGRLAVVAADDGKTRLVMRDPVTGIEYSREISSATEVKDVAVIERDGRCFMTARIDGALQSHEITKQQADHARLGKGGMALFNLLTGVFANELGAKKEERTSVKSESLGRALGERVEDLGLSEMRKGKVFADKDMKPVPVKDLQILGDVEHGFRMSAVIDGKPVAKEITERDAQKFSSLDPYRQLLLFSRLYKEDISIQDRSMLPLGTPEFVVQGVLTTEALRKEKASQIETSKGERQDLTAVYAIQRGAKHFLCIEQGGQVQVKEISPEQYEQIRNSENPARGLLAGVLKAFNLKVAVTVEDELGKSVSVERNVAGIAKDKELSEIAEHQYDLAEDAARSQGLSQGRGMS